MRHQLAGDDGLSGGGRADNDVGSLQQRGQIREARRDATHFPGELLRVRAAAVRDQELGGSACPQLPRRKLGHLAGAEQEHRAAGQVAQDLPRHLDRQRGDRDGATGNGRLGAHPLGGGERRRHGAGQGRSAGAGLERARMRGLDLPLDLRLADHHRVEAGRDAEQVRQRVVLEPDEGVLRDQRSQLPRDVVRRRARVHDGEHLQPVARGEEHRLADSRQRLEPAQACRQLVGRHGHLLAHGDGHLLVGEADAKEDRHGSDREQERCQPAVPATTGRFPAGAARPRNACAAPSARVLRDRAEVAQRKPGLL